MSTITAELSTAQPTAQQQAGGLLAQVAGYAGYRTIAIGLRCKLIQRLSEAAASPDELAASLGMDAFYVSVWCRGAIACGLCERADDRVALAPYMGELLLDETSPAYAGALFEVFSQPEFFDRFEEHLVDGDRLWWDECSAHLLQSVSRTSAPFYSRLVPGALDRIPGASELLASGTTAVDLGCGLGLGVTRLAEHYPRCRVIGIDGDTASIERARARTAAANASRIDFVCQPLENLDRRGEFGVVVSNLVMHECRDIDRVAQRVWESLEPGGHFVISDFPFPEDDATLRSVPGRVLAAIQFFEAQIDDQLLPRSAYDDLLTRHGFVGVGHLDLTPVHAVTFAHRPG